MNHLKSRLIYLAAVIVCIVLGLGSRAFAAELPPLLSRHSGDALWAGMVYFGFRLLLTERTRSLALVLSVLFSFSIEYSQLYQADWINAIRATTLGGLILGKGFLWIDLVRYSSGIAAAYLLDWTLLRLPAAVHK